MSEDQRERPSEMAAVRTAHVGVEPPGSGVPVGSIPHGVGILIQKAAVDPEFKVLLLEKRSAVAAELELSLSPAEATMLDSVPAGQLEAIIRTTKVPEKTRRALLGKVTVATLAAVGVIALIDAAARKVGPIFYDVRTAGIEPDFPPETETDSQPTTASPGRSGSTSSTRPAASAPSRGIQPDWPAASR